MAEADHRWTDEQLDRIISVLLRTGVIVASILVVIGGVLYLLHHPGPAPNYRRFQGEPAHFRDYKGIFKGLWSSEGRNWIQFGIAVLVATPVVRVAFSVFAFFEERDRRYVVLTLIVLGVLLFGLFGS